MASNDSIRRARLRPGHFLSLHSDRLFLRIPRPKSGRIFCFARIGSHRMAPELRGALNPTPGTRPDASAEPDKTLK